MRASTFGILGSIGLSLCVAAGDVGCAVKSSSHVLGGGSSEAASPVKPILDSVPATALTTQRYGIASWKVFLGRSQMVYEGYDANGKPVSGYQMAWFKAASGATSHLRVMPLDGSGSAMRLYGATTSGTFSSTQKQFFLHVAYDFQEYMASKGVVTGASAKVGVQPVKDFVVHEPGGGVAYEPAQRAFGVAPGLAPTGVERSGLAPTLGHAPVPFGPASGFGVREDWSWIGVGSFVLAGAAGVAAAASLPVTAAVIGVAAAGAGIYAYVTENPNTPAEAPVCQVSPTQTGDLQSTQTGENPSQQTFDQQWNQDMDSLNANQSCPSCSNGSGDLDVNPQNGDVQNGSDPNDPGGAQTQNGGATGDQNDPGASGDQGTPTQGSSSGSSSGGGDGAQDQATQDQGTQDQGTQDQGTQDQGSQDQGQDQAAQDQGQDQGQDQASQDQGSQDASQDQGQDALHPLHHRRRHHRHHHHTPKTAWGRVYAFFASQPQP
ncbi:MAG TPA: hypothetical protein VGG39_22075 [Polyangiaceae bacterium]|jgi:hypothetical protein